MLKDLAEAGNAEAQYQYGAWLNGFRDKFGDFGGMEWWERAAQQGHARAMWRLGDLYDGVHYNCYSEANKPDYVEAARWYRMGAERGDKDALEALGELDARREKAEQVSLERLEEARKLTGGPWGNEDDEEWSALARLFQYGNDAVPPNELRALVCFMKSAEWSKELEKQFKDILKAAERGDYAPLKAMCALGVSVTDEALRLAAGRGYPKGVKFLLEAGAAVNPKTEGGYTALMGAARGGHAEVV